MNNVDIKINVKGNYKTELKKVVGEAENFGKGINKMKSALSNVAAPLAIVTAGLVAAKKAFDFAKQGAELDMSINKFGRLSDSIGTTADALLKDLKEATRGTVSEMELMASAGDFMALGLAKSHDEVVRLTRVAGALGMNINQLTLTLTNKTTMRFDAIGVSVDGFKEKVKALEAAGLSADDAFKEAFLQQAEQQIEKVGDVADQSIGSYMRLEAELQDLKAEYKTLLNEAIEPIIKALADHAHKINEEISASQELHQMLEDGIITHERYNRAVENVTMGYTNYDQELKRAVDETGWYSIEMERARRMTEGGSDAVKILTGDMFDLADQTVKARNKFKEFADTVNNIDLSIGGKAAQLQEEIAAAIVPNADAVTKLYNIVYENLAILGPTLSAEMTQAVQAGAIALNLALGKINTEQAIEQLTGLGIPLAEAEAIVADVYGYLQKINGMVVEALIRINYQEGRGGGAGGFAPGGAGSRRQFGGHVMVGKSYIVGDAPGGKPEMFTPSTSGNITSNADLLSAMSNADILEGINSLRIDIKDGFLDLGQTIVRAVVG